MIGLTENPAALRKWMLATPELAKYNSSYEIALKQKESNGKHHSETKAARERFIKDVKSLQKTFKEKENPFLDTSTDLYNICTQKVCSLDVATFVKNVENLGLSQYRKFCEERLETASIPLDNTIKENKLKLFSSSQRLEVPKVKQQIKSLKEDCNLWSRLYVATCNNRPSELNEFFEHENKEFPPSLSLNGALRSTDKSELLKCLIDITKVESAGQCPPVDAKVLDGAVVIHMLKPGLSVTFNDYIDSVFLPFMEMESRSVSRLDIVWDR